MTLTNRFAEITEELSKQGKHQVIENAPVIYVDSSEAKYKLAKSNYGSHNIHLG